ncbi:response regulator transcription factor [Olivibacter sp. SDN3]|uniref:LuxR C-terminal-related transcriptional regulator n=1 Tax=Olivibacter sp. SDN3 TaxID=2764720 RepID=UPI0016510EEB|nr:LuxR C-terminal-related transcriptional regulator [Olivibacter sp. SDN3]QNL48363.1 response regulator transcription factor [Olivibacter sp. SDN3]
MKYKIAIGDENSIRRYALAELLLQEKIDIGKNESLTAISAYDFYGIDVLLLVVDQNVDTVLHIIENAKLTNNQLKIVVMDDINGIKHALKLISAGVNGYIAKNLDKDGLLFALNYVYQGNDYIDVDLTAKLFHRLSEFEAHIASFNANVTLTEKEKEILDLMVYGHANRDIAYRLFTTKRKVEEIREQMIKKTGAKDNLGLILYRLHKEFIRC